MVYCVCNPEMLKGELIAGYEVLKIDQEPMCVASVLVLRRTDGSVGFFPFDLTLHLRNGGGSIVTEHIVPDEYAYILLTSKDVQDLLIRHGAKPWEINECIDSYPSWLRYRAKKLLETSATYLRSKADYERLLYETG